MPSFPVSSLALRSSLAITRKQRQGESSLHLEDTAESLQRWLKLLSSTLEARHRTSGKHKAHSPSQLRNNTVIRELMTDDSRNETSGESFLRECHLCEYPIIHIKGILAKSH